jgi:hypothetical protein
MAYEISFKNNGFIVVQSGVISIDEINKANGDMHGHKEFDSHKYQIINLLDADFTEIIKKSYDEPAAMDWAGSLTQEKVKVAFVVQDPTAVNYCNSYISESKDMASPWDFALFADMKDALEWVDI